MQTTFLTMGCARQILSGFDLEHCAVALSPDRSSVLTNARGLNAFKTGLACVLEEEEVSTVRMHAARVRLPTTRLVACKQHDQASCTLSQCVSCRLQNNERELKYAERGLCFKVRSLCQKKCGSLHARFHFPICHVEGFF
jgi:hypothetical protein